MSAEEIVPTFVAFVGPKEPFLPSAENVRGPKAFDYGQKCEGP